LYVAKIGELEAIVLPNIKAYQRKSSLIITLNKLNPKVKSINLTDLKKGL